MFSIKSRVGVSRAIRSFGTTSSTRPSPPAADSTKPPNSPTSSSSSPSSPSPLSTPSPHTLPTVPSSIPKPPGPATQAKEEANLNAKERDAAALRRFEERFGGNEVAQLGVLEDGKPASMARSVRKNFFRVI